MGNSGNDVDTGCAITNRIHRDIVQSLQNLFRQYNELVQLFKTAFEQMPFDNHQIVIRVTMPDVSMHPL